MLPVDFEGRFAVPKSNVYLLLFHWEQLFIFLFLFFCRAAEFQQDAGSDLAKTASQLLGTFDDPKFANTEVRQCS